MEPLCTVTKGVIDEKNENFRFKHTLRKNVIEASSAQEALSDTAESISGKISGSANDKDRREQNQSLFDLLYNDPKDFEVSDDSDEAQKCERIVQADDINDSKSDKQQNDEVTKQEDIEVKDLEVSCKLDEEINHEKSDGQKEYKVYEQEDYKAHKQEEDEAKRWKMFSKLAEDIDHEMATLWIKRLKNPDDHPKYRDEYSKFWKKRYKDLRANGKKVTSSRSIELEWRRVWMNRLFEIHKEETDSKKMIVRRMLGLEDGTQQANLFAQDSSDSRKFSGSRSRSHLSKDQHRRHRDSPCLEASLYSDKSSTRRRSHSRRRDSPCLEDSSTSRRQSPLRKRHHPKNSTYYYRESLSHSRGRNNGKSRPEKSLRRKGYPPQYKGRGDSKSPSKTWSPCSEISPSHRGRSPAGKRESPSRRREFPSRHRESPFRRRESPSGGRDSPVRHRESPCRLRESSSCSRDFPVLHRESPRSRRESPSSGGDYLVRHRESSRRHRELPSSCGELRERSRCEEELEKEERLSEEKSRTCGEWSEEDSVKILMEVPAADAVHKDNFLSQNESNVYGVERNTTQIDLEDTDGQKSSKIPEVATVSMQLIQSKMDQKSSQYKYTLNDIENNDKYSSFSVLNTTSRLDEEGRKEKPHSGVIEREDKNSLENVLMIAAKRVKENEKVLEVKKQKIEDDRLNTPQSFVMSLISTIEKSDTASPTIKQDSTETKQTKNGKIKIRSNIPASWDAINEFDLGTL